MTSEARPRSPALIRFVRAVVPLLMVLGGSYWACLSFWSFPWIVPADHDIDLVRLYGDAAIHKSWMIHVSLALILTSFLIRRRPLWTLGISTITLAWLIYLQATYRVHGDVPGESYRWWVTGTYIGVDVFLIAMAAAILKRKAPHSGTHSETGNPST